MKPLSRYLHLFYLLMLAVAITQSLSGQTFRGGIAGTVQDSTGAVVANAKITLIGTETGSKHETLSTSSSGLNLRRLVDAQDRHRDTLSAEGTPASAP